MKTLTFLITLVFAVIINPMFIDDVSGDPNNVKEINASLNNTVSINNIAAVETYYSGNPAVQQNPNYSRMVFIYKNDNWNTDNYQFILSAQRVDTVHPNFLRSLN